MSTRPEFTVYVKQRSFTHPLPTGGTLRVGRGADVHICVDDPSVSREHLLIHVQDGCLEVEDLGSSNGTTIMRSRGSDAAEVLQINRRYAVTLGDMLRIGSVPALIQSAGSLPTPDRVTTPPPSIRSRILAAPEMKRIYELAGRAATSDIGVLILGETGAGKELLASHVHENSPRARKPFLQLNCASLTESLLESELFGHEKGAFTGAVGARAGLLESAAGGTVFLDELGEMPLSIQVKLLRVLEERRIRRLGATRSIPIDVRFVAATNRNLELEMQAGRFRGDLYYRISGITLNIPPLRERQEEIEPLARHFLHEFCLRSGIAEPQITSEGLRTLLTYRWPGNVRELKNVMERAPLLSAGLPLSGEHLPSRGQDLDLDSEDFLDDERTDVGYIPQGLGTPVVSYPGSNRVHPLTRTQTAPLRGNAGPSAGAYRMSRPHSEGELMPPLGESERWLPPGATSHQSGVPLAAGPFQANAAVDVVGSLTHGNSKCFSEESDRDSIIRALDECSGNQTRAARMLGVSRRTLINRIESFGLPRPRKR